MTTAGRPTLAELLAETRRRFADAGIADPASDARVLVSGILGLSSTDMITRSGEVLSPSDEEKVEAAIGRRLKREPVYRILGWREFHDLDLHLSPGTLDPRPDTEILVDTVLPYLRQIVAEKEGARILDMGTGTGAICLALLKECPQVQGVGSDISEDALARATANAQLNGLADRFVAVESHWFDKIEGRFDIIVSNPPYINSDVIPALEPEVRDFDPLAALDGGKDGLDAYRSIAAEAGQFLEASGMIGLEIGYDQKDAVTDIFTKAGFGFVDAVRDYGGRDRVLVFSVCRV